MINGLTHEGICELRKLFPRLLIAELVSRIAAFENVCWAGAAYLGGQIGRSSRTVFRYYRILVDAGILQRRWGPRDPKDMHPDIEEPDPLHRRGYKLTGFVGWLNGFVAGNRRTVVTNWEAKRARDKERRRQKQAERRQAHAKRHAAIKADQAAIEQEFGALGKAIANRDEQEWIPSRGRPRHVGTVLGQAAVGPAPQGRNTGPPKTTER